MVYLVEESRFCCLKDKITRNPVGSPWICVKDPILISTRNTVSITSGVDF